MPAPSLPAFPDTRPVDAGFDAFFSIDLRPPAVVRRTRRNLGARHITPCRRAKAIRDAGALPPSCVIGTGLEPVVPPTRPRELTSLGIRGPFVLYLGRVDPNKGCETLLRYFQEFIDREGTRVQLVLAGPVFMPVPSHPAIVPLGFVDEDTRADLANDLGYVQAIETAIRNEGIGR